jgi:hygromycin-B 4-O-kinase
MEESRMMFSVKPTVERGQILRLLEAYFAQSVTDLQPLEGGQIAQVLAFTVGGQDHVLRVHAQVMGANVEKEAYIAQPIASSVPVPAIVHVGRLGDMPYAITRTCPGQRLITLPPQEVDALLPTLMDVLDAIHGAEMSPAPGYGLFDVRGVGMFPTGQRSLEVVREEEPDWDVDGRWHDLFDHTVLERDAFDRIDAQMEHLLDCCPEQHSLVHGNFAYSNVLVEHGEMTAVPGWVDATYGDPLVDMAMLDFWDPDHDIQRRYARRRAEKGETESQCGERVLCYQCNISLEAMKFFAKTDQQSRYRWTRARILDLMGE